MPDWRCVDLFGDQSSWVIQIIFAYVYISWSYLHIIEFLGQLTSVFNCPPFLHYAKVSLHRITQNPLSYLDDKKEAKCQLFDEKSLKNFSWLLAVANFQHRWIHTRSFSADPFWSQSKYNGLKSEYNRWSTS